jgi:glutamine synthetase
MGACAVDLVGNLAGMTVRARRRAVNAWTAEQRQLAADVAGGVTLDAMAAASMLIAQATDTTSTQAAAQLARAAKDAAIVAGIRCDKANRLAGEPTDRTERVDPDELRARLAKLLSIELPSHGLP